MDEPTMAPKPKLAPLSKPASLKAGQLPSLGKPLTSEPLLGALAETPPSTAAPEEAGQPPVERASMGEGEGVVGLEPQAEPEASAEPQPAEGDPEAEPGESGPADLDSTLVHRDLDLSAIEPEDEPAAFEAPSDAEPGTAAEPAQSPRGSASTLDPGQPEAPPPPPPALADDAEPEEAGALEPVEPEVAPEPAATEPEQSAHSYAHLSPVPIEPTPVKSKPIQFPQILHKPKAVAIASDAAAAAAAAGVPGSGYGGAGAAAPPAPPPPPPMQQQFASEPPPLSAGFEASLLQEIQDIVANECGGSAKLLVVGGIGASQGKRSVFRLWNKVLEAHGEAGRGPDDPVDPALFESLLGGDYILQDLHALDLATLQWSEPVPRDPMPQPRAGHAAVLVPVRVTVPLPGASPRPAGVSDSTPLQARDLDIASLMRSLAAHTADVQHGVGRGERETVGKFLLESLLASLRRALATGTTKGLVGEGLAMSLLDALLGGRPVLRDAAIKALLGRTKGKKDLIHVEDIHAALVATKGAMDHMPDVFVTARSVPVPSGGSYSVAVRAEVVAMRAVTPLPDKLTITLALESGGIPEVSGPRVPGTTQVGPTATASAAPSDKPDEKSGSVPDKAPDRILVEQTWPLGLGSDPEIVRAFSEIATGTAPANLVIKLQAIKAGVRLPGQKGDAAFTLGHCRVDLRALTRDLTNKDLDMIGIKKDVIAKLRLSVVATSALRSLQRRAARSAVEAFRLHLTYGQTLGPLKPYADESKEALRGLELAAPAGPLIYDAVSNGWREGRIAQGDYTPVQRVHHTATRVGRHIFVFGGFGGVSQATGDPTPLARLEMINLYDNTARALAPSGTGPGPRAGHTAVFVEAPPDPSSLSPGAVIYYGGRGESDSLFMDVHLLHLGHEPVTSRWDEPSVDRPQGMGGRCNHAACLVRVQGSWSMYVFGGRIYSPRRPDHFDLTSSLLRLSPKEDGHSVTELKWEEVECKGPVPPARELCAMQAIGTKILMCGGWLGMQQAPWIRDFWIMDTARNGWVSLVFEDRWPSARFSHAASIVDYRSTSVRHCTLHGIQLSGDLATGSLRMESEAGRPVELEIRARDPSGLLVDRGGDVFLSLLKLASKQAEGPIVTPQVEDLGWGRYRLSFSVTRAQEYLLHVADEIGTPISGSPVGVTITPAALAPARTLLLGGALADTKAGEVCQFTMLPHDIYGNRLPVQAAPPEIFTVTIAGRSDPVRAKVTVDEARGVLVGSFTPEKTGKYMMSVKCNGFHIDGSPFRIGVSPAASDITQFTLSGRVLTGRRWFSGAPASIIVTSRDRFGNRRYEGGDKIAVRVFSRPAAAAEDDDSAMTPIQVTVEDSGDGTYKCGFKPEKLGIYSVICSLKGRPDLLAEGCPQKFKVTNSHLLVANCEISGLGVDGKTHQGHPRCLLAGEEASFIIQAKDDQGNLMEGGNDLFACWIERVDGRRGRLIAQVMDNGDGTYTVSYTPKEEGVVRLHLEGTSGFRERQEYLAHPRCPLELSVVSNVTEPSMCFAGGEGVFGLTTVGEMTNFTVVANDKHGNRRRVGGDLLESIVEGEGTVPCTVRDNRDGSYTVSYKPIVDKKKFKNCVFKVSVSINGRPIWRSPYFQRVTAVRAYAPLCYFEGAPDKLTAGHPSQFMLIACDPDGRPLTTGAEPFKLTVEGNPLSRGELRDLRDGRYLVRVIAEEMASYKVHVSVTLKDEHVAGSPVTMLVVPPGLFNVGFWAGAKQVDEAMAAQFVISGKGSETAVAGERASFEIVAKRLDELPPPTAFISELRGPEDVPVTVVGPLEGGIYKCTYVCTKAGVYTGICKIGRMPLPGSPLNVTIEGDETDPAKCLIEGPGLVACDVDSEASFRISPRDQHGNPSGSKIDYWRIQLIGGMLHKVVGSKVGKFRATSVEGKVFKNMDGTYTAKYMLPDAGAFSLDVFHSRHVTGPWTLVKGSPYSIICKRPLAPGVATRAVLDRDEARRMGAAAAVESVAATAAKETARATFEIEAAQNLKGKTFMSKRYSVTEVRMEHEGLQAGGGRSGASRFDTDAWKKDGLLALGTWGQRETLDKAVRNFAHKDESLRATDPDQLAVEELISNGGSKRSTQMGVLTRLTVLATKAQTDKKRKLSIAKSSKTQKHLGGGPGGVGLPHIGPGPGPG